MSSQGPASQSPASKTLNIVINGHGAQVPGESESWDLVPGHALIAPYDLHKPFILCAAEDYHLETATVQGKLNHLDGRAWKVYAGFKSKKIPDVALSAWQDDELKNFATEILEDKTKWANVDHREEQLYLAYDSEATLVFYKDGAFVTKKGMELDEYLRKVKSGTLGSTQGRPAFFYARKIGKVKIVSDIKLSEVVRYFNSDVDTYRFILATCNSATPRDKTISLVHEMDPLDIGQLIQSQTKLEVPASPRTKQATKKALKSNLSESDDSDDSGISDLEKEWRVRPYSYFNMFDSIDRPILLVAKRKENFDGCTDIISPVIVSRSSQIDNELDIPTSVLAKTMREGQLSLQRHRFWDVHLPGEDLPLQNYTLEPSCDAESFLALLQHDTQLFTKIDGEQGLYFDRDPDARLILKKPSGELAFLNKGLSEIYINQLLKNPEMEEIAGKFVGFYAPKVGIFQLLMTTDMKVVSWIMQRGFLSTLVAANTRDDLYRYQRFALTQTKTKTLSVESLLANKILEPSVVANMLSNGHTDSIMQALRIQRMDAPNSIAFGPEIKNAATYEFELLIRALLEGVKYPDESIQQPLYRLDTVEDKLHLFIHGRKFCLTDILENTHFKMIDLSLLSHLYLKFLCHDCSFLEAKSNLAPVYESYENIQQIKQNILFSDYSALKLYTSDEIHPVYLEPYFNYMNDLLRDPYCLDEYKSDPNFMFEILIHMGFVCNAMNKLSPKNSKDELSFRLESELPSFVRDARRQAYSTGEAFIESGALSSSFNLEAARQAVSDSDSIVLFSGRGADVACFSKFHDELETVYVPKSAWRIDYLTEHCGRSYMVAQNVYTSNVTTNQGPGFGQLDIDFLSELDELYQRLSHDTRTLNSGVILLIEELRTQVINVMTLEGAMNILKSPIPNIISAHLKELKAMEVLDSNNLILYDFLKQFKDNHFGMAYLRCSTFIKAVDTASSVDTLHEVVEKRFKHEYNLIGVKLYTCQMKTQTRVSKADFEATLDILKKAIAGDLSLVEACPIDFVKDKLVSLLSLQVGKASRLLIFSEAAAQGAGVPSASVVQDASTAPSTPERKPRLGTRS